MSKELKVTMYVNDNVTSIARCRDNAKTCEEERKELKEQMWGLVMATPKDITPQGEDPSSWVRERFDEIWEQLWDAFVNDYKYTTIADDAEFDEDSTIPKQWEEEIADLEELRTESAERNTFFEKYNDVMNKYNFDDMLLYDMIKDGTVELPSPFTKEVKDAMIKKIHEDEENLLKCSMKGMKDGE